MITFSEKKKIGTRIRVHVYVCLCVYELRGGCEGIYSKLLMVILRDGNGSCGGGTGVGRDIHFFFLYFFTV